MAPCLYSDCTVSNTWTTHDHEAALALMFDTQALLEGGNGLSVPPYMDIYWSSNIVTAARRVVRGAQRSCGRVLGQLDT